MADQAVLRITREIRQIQKGKDLSLAVAVQESDIRDVKALIVGPADSPYQFGFFEFTIKFPSEYPGSPPKVQAITTNSGRCRFNPNIYAEGKVCLSILGTWRGQRGEEWSSAQGLESILISIQSLMSGNPYENEPGFENADTREDRENMAHYIAKIRHETIRLAVIRPLENSLSIKPDGAWMDESNSDDSEDEEALSAPTKFDPFNDLRKRRFLWYFESYMQIVEDEGVKVDAKTPFRTMPFESKGNTMDGHFDYPQLREDLLLIRDRVLEETRNWAPQGLLAKKRDLSIACNLQRQYEQILADIQKQNAFTVDLSLENDNPFLWKLTYFGRPMSHLDGGIFKILIHLSPRFPEELPRVFVKTPIFHHRVSKAGVLCYLPDKPDEMRHHIEAIVQALEEESPPYDPRTTVNLEASKLFWGSADDKKKYRRMLRRSVERSAEELGA